MAHPMASPRRHRPHPAQRARKIVATTSVAALCGLAGVMATQSTGGSATTTDRPTTGSGAGSATDDSVQSPDHWQSGGGGSGWIDSSGTDRWGAQTAPGGGTSSTPAPDVSSHAS